MPELVEAEITTLALRRLIGARVRSVEILDPRVERSDELGRGLAAVVGQRLTGVHRLGKSVEVTCDDATVLRVRFGMSGRMVIDGRSAIGDLLYGPDDARAIWDRVRLDTDRGAIAFNDPRRFGAIEVNPAPLVLGPDATTWTAGQTRSLVGRRRPIKPLLLDQSVVAGVGNLAADEILWRIGLDPHQPAGDLGERARGRLADSTREVMAMLLERGGSHLGDLVGFRHSGALCPVDYTPLERSRISGRTAVWCPAHQRGADELQ